MTKTLEQIEADVGKDLFDLWKSHAQAHLKRNPDIYVTSQQKDLYVYGELTRRYTIYRGHMRHIPEEMR